MLSGFIASICSYSHVMVFDICSDTILYLQTLREMKEEEAEQELRFLAGGGLNVYDMFRDVVRSAYACAIPF